LIFSWNLTSEFRNAIHIFAKVAIFVGTETSIKTWEETAAPANQINSQWATSGFEMFVNG
jgi:hypothetical protein